MVPFEHVPEPAFSLARKTRLKRAMLPVAVVSREAATCAATVRDDVTAVEQAAGGDVLQGFKT
jgi:hypothetical protein